MNKTINKNEHSKLISKILLLLVLLAGLISCQNSKNSEKQQSHSENSRPNIIYIMADDLTTQAVTAYNDRFKGVADTPNIDRLANEGMLFQDVICTNAICGPSRAAILTGNYSHVNGYYKNESGGKFDASQWTFPQKFQKSGYKTSLFGKWHLGSEPKGFDDYKYHVAAGQQGLYWNPVYNENGKEVKEKGYATNLTTDFAIKWLQENNNSDTPFLMLLQFKAPHRPWRPDKKYEDLWEDETLPYPTTFNDDYKGRKKTAGDTDMTLEFLNRRDMKLETPDSLEGVERKTWEFYGAKRGEVVIPEGMTDEEAKYWRYQTYIKDYLACIKSIDDNIGRVLDYLDENNLANNTMIILTSDQGFYLGDHGFFDKRFIYEESLRMPFIVRYPKIVKAGAENTDLLANIDFAPTLLDIAGINPGVKMQGRSFKKALKGENLENWREGVYYHYYEFPFWHHVQPHYGIRTQRYTLAHFYYNIDQWELYDNKKDSEQIHNLIDQPEYADVVKNLKQRLKELMKKYDDDKSLEEFRAISDKDFGDIMERKMDTIKNILTNSEDENI